MLRNPWGCRNLSWIDSSFHVNWLREFHSRVKWNALPYLFIDWCLHGAKLHASALQKFSVPQFCLTDKNLVLQRVFLIQHCCFSPLMNKEHNFETSLLKPDACSSRCSCKEKIMSSLDYKLEEMLYLLIFLQSDHFLTLFHLVNLSLNIMLLVCGRFKSTGMLQWS